MDKQTFLTILEAMILIYETKLTPEQLHVQFGFNLKISKLASKIIEIIKNDLS